MLLALALALAQPAHAAETVHLFLKAKEGVSLSAIAQATSPIEVGTFKHADKVWSVRCKGGGRTFSCNAATQGVEPIALQPQALKDGEMIQEMMAMNMQFLLHTPTTVVPEPQQVVLK